MPIGELGASAAARILRVIDGASGAPLHGDTARRVEIHDYACLDDEPGGVVFLLAVVVHGPQRPAARYFVPIARWGERNSAATMDLPELLDHPQLDIEHPTLCDLFHGILFRGLLRRGRIDTRQGNQIVLSSAPGRPSWDAVSTLASPGPSSNTVVTLQIDGREYVHKLYRRLDPGNQEIRAYAALADSDAVDTTVPRLILGYSYRDRRSGETCPLGLLCESFRGTSLDQALSTSIRALWQGLQGPGVGEESARTVATAHVEPVRGLLEHCGAFVRRFQVDLNRRFANNVPEMPPFDLVGFCRRLEERGQDVRQRVKRDPVAGEARGCILASLDALLASCGERHLGTDPTMSAASLPHGDLHLSHLLCRRNASGWEMKVVDISTRCLDARCAEFQLQSAWQDLIALNRAIEYLVCDECNDEIARVLGTTGERAARERVRVLSDPSAPRISDREGERSAVAAIEAASDQWTSEVWQTLLRGYLGIAATTHPGASAACDDQMWRALYAARLLQEMEYNFVHDRLYYRLIDYYWLAKKARRWKEY